MTKLTRLTVSTLAASLALSVAVPASAATWHGREDLRAQIAQLDRKIDQAEKRHLISHREADRLEKKVDQLQQLHRNLARNGITRAEQRLLERRIDAVERQVARELNDRDGRPNAGHDNDRGDYRR